MNGILLISNSLMLKRIMIFSLLSITQILLRFYLVGIHDLNIHDYLHT